MPSRAGWMRGMLLGSAVAALALWRRALSLDGAIAAALIGAITFARGGRSGAAALLSFFVSSSALSRVAENRKRGLPLAQSKGAQRDAWQVLANGGVATLCALLGRPEAMVGALAAAAADTWATELGLLARQPPRLITTLRQVPAGTSGGVTPEGLLASFGGAVTVGVSQLPFGTDLRPVRKAALAGVGGALLDSLLGATLQAAYFCGQCVVPTEDAVHAPCGSPTELQHGLRWMTNDTVNALATLAGALLALL